MVYVYYKYGDPYCGFSGGSHGKMLKTSRRSQRDGGLRVYYACRCDGCSNTSLEYSKPKGMKREEFERLVKEDNLKKLRGWVKYKQAYRTYSIKSVRALKLIEFKTPGSLSHQSPIVSLIKGVLNLPKLYSGATLLTK